MAEVKPSKIIEQEKLEQSKKAGPSGSTETLKEREKKFDEEGGDQPQAPSQQAVDDELSKVLKEPNSEPHSMGSEGRPHSESGQHQTPEEFEDRSKERKIDRSAGSEFLDDETHKSSR
jgi:hypothetical protein